MSRKGSVKFVNPNQHLFYQTLKQNVQQYFSEKGISTHANASMVIKSIVMITAYITPFIIILFVQPAFWVSLCLWVLMGIAFAGIGMGVMHDANHGAYSSNQMVNKLMGYSVNLAGSVVFNWKLQHNVLHHTYTNITGLDDDIQSKGGMRFTEHDELKPAHRLQFIYIFAHYSIMTLYWIIAKDFVQFVRYRRQGVNAVSKQEYRIQFLRLMLVKTTYFFAILVMPTLIFGIPFWQVITGFVVMHVTGSLILSLVFQLAHTVEDTDHPLPDAEGNIHNIWAVHQLHTTMNFSPGNRLLNWYVGGLNHQVEHHLFPKICHVHYPDIAPIVKRTAAEFNMPYLESPTFLTAFRSHMRLLYKLGRVPKLDDIMD